MQALAYDSAWLLTSTFKHLDSAAVQALQSIGIRHMHSPLDLSTAFTHTCQHKAALPKHSRHTVATQSPHSRHTVATQSPHSRHMENVRYFAFRYPEEKFQLYRIFLGDGEMQNTLRFPCGDCVATVWRLCGDCVATEWRLWFVSKRPDSAELGVVADLCRYAHI